MTSRKISRSVVGLAVLLLGIVAWTRLELAFLPTWTFPELMVKLRLAEAGEPAEVTRKWLVPVESAIRSLGRVEGQAGEVSSRGFEMRVRFEPGVDAERKAARLESELQTLRRGLPFGATLAVSPVRQGASGPSAILWLPGEPGRAPLGLTRALEDLPEVEGVVVAGLRRPELLLTTPSTDSDLDLTAGQKHLGYRLDGGRFGRVVAKNDVGPASAARSSGAAVSAIDLAEKELRSEEPDLVARADGRSGQVLLVSREYEASPPAFSRAVEGVLEARGLRGSVKILLDDGEILRRLLQRAAWGLAAASLLLAAACGLLWGPRHGILQLFLLPLAASAVVQVAWAREIPLDVTTFPAAAVAVASALLFQILRVGGDRSWPLAWVTAAACVLPITVALWGGKLGAFLGAPAWLFALGTPVACLSTLILPAPPATPTRWSRKALRFALRRPWGVLLGGLVTGYLLFLVFGSALMPAPGSLTTTAADLFIQLRFPEASTVGEAEKEVARVEAFLATREEVQGQWSIVYPSYGVVAVDIRPEDSSRPRLAGLAARFEVRLSSVAASVRAVPLGNFGGEEALRFAAGLEAEAEADREITFYRLVLRSTDLDKLRLAYGRLLDGMSRSRWQPTREMIFPDWGEPTPRLELVPKPGVSGEDVDRATEFLGLRSRPPAVGSVVALPGSELEMALRVAADTAPRNDRDLPDRETLLRVPVAGADASPTAGALSAADLFDLREGMSAPVVQRQNGMFVLPVTVRFLYLAIGQRPLARADLRRAIRKTRLPVGVSLELPTHGSVYFTPERKQLLKVASTLPLLLLALGICRIGSVPLGFAALTPAVFAFGIAGPAARLAGDRLDEMMLMVLVFVIAAAAPLAMEGAAALRIGKASPLAVGRGYRWLISRLPVALAVTAAWAVFFFVLAVGLDGERHPWVAGAWISLATAPAAVLGSFFFLPVLLRTVDLVRLRDREEAARRAAPPAWSEAGEVSLTARNLSKVYGNGFQALRAVSFHLEPGIIGLLGPNGAGKTTLLRSLCGLLEPTRGQILFRGEPVRPENRSGYRRLVGFLPQSFNAYEGIPVAAFLEYWALQIGIENSRARSEEIERVLHAVDLADSADKKVRQLSGGMRRRIGIARALLGSPPILIVDEPTTGLDVESRNRLRENLLSVAGERIILFSTHIAGDVAATASRILLIDGGRLIFDGSTGSLVDEAHGRIFETLVEDDRLREFSKRYRVTTRLRTLEGIRVRAVAGKNQEPAGTIVRPNLEEAYLAKLDLGPQAAGERRRGVSLLDLGAD